MTTENTIKTANFAQTAVRNQEIRTWWTIGAMIGLIGGFLNIILGNLLSLEIWLIDISQVSFPFEPLANGLLYSVLPLLFFGAYCLDKVDEKKKK